MTFRNNIGVGIIGPMDKLKAAVRFFKGSFRFIRFGLFPGSGDRIGWRVVTITPDMVGQKIAQFLSVEIKTVVDRMSEEQKRWADAVRRDGGRAEIWKDTQKGIDIEY